MLTHSERQAADPVFAAALASYNASGMTSKTYPYFRARCTDTWSSSQTITPPAGVYTQFVCHTNRVRREVIERFFSNMCETTACGDPQRPGGWRQRGLLRSYATVVQCGQQNPPLPELLHRVRRYYNQFFEEISTSSGSTAYKPNLGLAIGERYILSEPVSRSMGLVKGL